MANIDTAGDRAPRASLFYDPKVRGIVFQTVMFVLLVAFFYWITANTVANLARAGIASGFGFLKGRAGFDIASTLIPFTSDSTYGRALVVGMLNTIQVAAFGIVTATIVGFLIGIGRLSRNWLVRKLSTVYVEIFRNIPPLLVIFFWYFGVLSVLPQPKESIALPFGSYLNSRGFFLVKPIFGEGSWLIVAGLVVGVALAIYVARRAAQRQAATGKPFPVFSVSAGLVFGLPLLGFLAAGLPVTFEFPKLGTFNMQGGARVQPEFLALYLALSFYTAAFIAEIVRGGIVGVHRGQSEAAHALGLRHGPTLRLVVVPQALRIIIPPLTSQYLNLTKNSSLAIAIGFPDLVAVGGTILNQTGQAVEVVVIWMAIYLGLSLLTSAFMNWFNAKMALVER
ncbi:MAG: amino acid ABC transporter permease [Phyllobacteriaceae bacterium]|nr:amino acid ABC transporter permease [Phyllobacteriaceae bacterium]